MRKTIMAAFALVLVGAGNPAPSLSAYIGKYPSDKVAGISLYNNPKFRILVSGAAPNMSIRTTVLTNGVETPVERQGALLVARVCEPHNCNGHQWTVAILLPNGPAAICYHDGDLMDGDARWFIGGTSIGRSQGCWEGNHTDVPDAVITRLARGH